jgi:hypothetical protein
VAEKKIGYIDFISSKTKKKRKKSGFPTKLFLIPSRDVGKKEYTRKPQQF